MLCSKCGSENAPNMKFCGECAAPFAAACPKCGFDNPPGRKFCGQCASPLSRSTPSNVKVPETSADRPSIMRVAPQTADTLEGERKTVTVLFADIKGSMELMEDLDPEEARAIVDPALKLMMDAVHRYDGYVAQSTGDGITTSTASCPVLLEPSSKLCGPQSLSGLRFGALQLRMRQVVKRQRRLMDRTMDDLRRCVNPTRMMVIVMAVMMVMRGRLIACVRD